MIRFRLSMRSRMLAVAICGLLCVPFSLIVRRQINARIESRCAANLAAIGVAMHAYHAKHGHFPPAYVVDKKGRPIHSWRVLLLEFLDPPLFSDYDFNEPWDGPHNRKLAQAMPRVYACPSRQFADSKSRTSYAVIVGPESPFPGSGVVKISDIRPASSNVAVILVAEVANKDILWTEPTDLETSRMSLAVNDSSQPRISSLDRGGAGVLLLDGSAKRIKPSIVKPILESLLSISSRYSRSECK